MTTIRLRQEADLEQCASLMKEVYTSDGYPVEGADDARKFLSDPKIQAAWIAEREGNIIGHVCINKPTPGDASVALWWQQHGTKEPIAVLGRLFLHREARSSGLAAKLLDAAVSWASNRGLRLVLFALTRIPAPIRFYERQGWHRFGETYHECATDGKRYPAICFTWPTGGS